MTDLFLYFCISLWIYVDTNEFGIKGAFVMTFGTIVVSLLLYFIEAKLSMDIPSYYAAAPMVGLATVTLIVNSREYMRKRLKQKR